MFYTGKNKKKELRMLVNLFSYNLDNSNFKLNKTNYEIKNKFQQDVFVRNNQLNFKGNHGIVFFDDVAKMIRQGDLEAVKKIVDPHAINSKLQSYLHIAAEEKQPEIAEHLLSLGLDLNQGDAAKMTPFAIACRAQDESMFDLFMNHSPDVNTSNSLGDTPLHHVIPNQRLLGALLDKRANPHARNESGLPVLHSAAVDLTAVEYLLKRGVNPDSINDAEQTLMHTAAIDGNQGLVSMLLKHGAEINFRDKELKTPVFYSRDRKTLDFLLEKGADPNMQDLEQRTALHHFVINRNYDLAAGILDFSANPNVVDKQKMTPILYPTILAIRKLLLKYGADPSVKMPNGNTLLHVSVQKAKEDAIATLLSHKADVNAVDKNGKAPLYYAKTNKIRKMLLKHGANPNAELYLHSALKTKDKEFANALLEAKADVNIEDANGRTPIFYCNDMEDLINLYKNGADISHKDANGNTPVHKFALEGNLKMVSFLEELGAEIKAVNDNGEAAADLYSMYQKYDSWIKK